MLNFKTSKEKENKQTAISKRKVINKSSDKIGPKIISKYSIGKYNSNFDDVASFDDVFEGDTHMVIDDEIQLDGPELA